MPEHDPLFFAPQTIPGQIAMPTDPVHDHLPETVYAVCGYCGHTEPRPARAADDWSGCENCPAPAREVEMFDDPDIAEDASEIVLANNADDLARRRSGGDASIDARYEVI